MAEATDLFRFNDTLVDAVVSNDHELANEIERRLEQWLDQLKPTRPYLCLVSDSTGQSLASSTVTTLTYNTDDYDPEDWHSTSTNTNRITPTVAGWYEATLSVALGSTLTATNRLQIALKNQAGTTFAAFDGYAGHAIPRRTVTGHVFLDGDTNFITSTVFHNNGSAQTISGVRLALEFLGRT